MRSRSRSSTPRTMALGGPVVVATLAVVAALTSACSSSDGRTLPAPDPHKTTTSLSTPVVGQPSDGGDAAGGDGAAIEVFSLSSGAFTDAAPIPARHTCAGDDLSPPLAWASMPATAELALVVRDRDAAGYVHWVLTGIDPSVQGLGEGGVPETAVEAQNGSGTLGWLGPCPPAGSGTHTYVFTLHALPEPLGLATGTTAEEAARLVEGASSDQAVLTGTVTAAA